VLLNDAPELLGCGRHVEMPDPERLQPSKSALVIAAGAPIAPASPLLSGISAGLAFVTRETSAIIVLFYGILFLLGCRAPISF
jgi:hypothetical protein